MIDDYYLAQLDREKHLRDLQSLYDRCSDFVQMAFGTPSHQSAAEEDFAFSRNMVYGIYSREGHLIGALELLRDYPKPDEWWIGLLMLDPAARGQGLGERVCRATLDRIANEGGRVVWLAVLVHNERAHKFWTRMGFVETERQQWVAGNGYESTVVLMKQGIRAG